MQAAESRPAGVRKFDPTYRQNIGAPTCPRKTEINRQRLQK